MKKHILLSIAAAMVALPVSAQDAPPPSDKPCSCECGGHKRDHHRKMNPEKRGMASLGKSLAMEKYDKDKDNKLSDEEKAVIKEDNKKIHEARKAEMLKKFDKDGDGKLSKDERKGMREEWEKAHPEIVKKMEAGKAEMLKKFDKDGDGKLSDEEKAARREEAKNKGPHHKKHKGGKHGKRPHGGPVAMAGMALIMEKYDADKDGMLSESESSAMKADAKKAMEARKAARKADKNDMNDKDDDMLHPPSPHEEGSENDGE